MKRICWIALGVLSLGIGMLGAFLPGLPTTVFVLGAAACFAKSSPSLHARIMEHRWTGPMIRSYRTIGVTPLKKVMIIVSMTISIGLGAYHLKDSTLWLHLLIGIWIISVPVIVRLPYDKHAHEALKKQTESPLA